MLTLKMFLYALAPELSSQSPGSIGTVLYANLDIFVRVGQRRGGILQNALRTETNF